MTSQGLTVLGLEMAPEGLIAETGCILPGLTPYLHPLLELTQLPAAPVCPSLRSFEPVISTMCRPAQPAVNAQTNQKDSLSIKPANRRQVRYLG